MEKTPKQPPDFQEWPPLDVFLHIGEHIARFFEAGSNTATYNISQYFPRGSNEAFATALSFAITALELKQQEATDAFKQRDLGEAVRRLQIVLTRVKTTGEGRISYPGIIDMGADQTGDASHIINAHNLLAPPNGYQL